MSGGHWNYAGSRIENELLEIANDEAVIRRWPHLAALLANLAPELNRCEHDMDWDLSCDSIIKDDRVWERERLSALAAVLLRSPAGEPGRMKIALENVLIFYTAGPWAFEAELTWQNNCIQLLGTPPHLTGFDASTKVLCDCVRAALKPVA